ncbi:hypothetical protein ACTG9Q_01785 [Actinokineospora sp. 24-640]
MRRLLGSALVIVAAGAAASLGPTATAAPLPFLAVDCAQTVHAFRGQPVHLSRIAVSRLVTTAVRQTEGLGTLRSASVGLAFPLGPAIPVGTVPGGDGRITGAAIADAVAEVVAPMPEVAPAADVATEAVRALVADSCGMDVRALDPAGETPGETPVAPPAKPGAGGDPSTTPNTQPVGGADPAPGEVALYDPARFARAAQRDHGEVPAARAGLFLPSPDARYGAVPGYTPQFGLLGQDEAAVRTAGGAQALLPVGGGQVAFPILLAVLLLSVVTGALVRTWVLRRA